MIIRNNEVPLLSYLFEAICLQLLFVSVWLNHPLSYFECNSYARCLKLQKINISFIHYKKKKWWHSTNKQHPSQLVDVIPIIQDSIVGTRIIGCLCSSQSLLTFYLLSSSINLTKYWPHQNFLCFQVIKMGYFCHTIQIKVTQNLFLVWYVHVFECISTLCTHPYQILMMLGCRILETY